MPGVSILFGQRLRDLHIWHLRTEISSPWTNGKIEASWGVPQQRSSIASASPASPSTTTTIG